jgi:hypothetical protein
MFDAVVGTELRFGGTYAAAGNALIPANERPSLRS